MTNVTLWGVTPEFCDSPTPPTQAEGGTSGAVSPCWAAATEPGRPMVIDVGEAVTPLAVTPTLAISPAVRPVDPVTALQAATVAPGVLALDLQLLERACACEAGRQAVTALQQGLSQPVTASALILTTRLGHTAAMGLLSGLLHWWATAADGHCHSSGVTAGVTAGGCDGLAVTAGTVGPLLAMDPAVLVTSAGTKVGATPVAGGVTLLQVCWL